MTFCKYTKTGIAMLILGASFYFSGCPKSQPQIREPVPQKLEQRIAHENAQPNGKSDKYAVLINGSDEWRFRMDTCLIYQILLENGFQKENIYILDEEGKEDFLYPADDIAGRKIIEALFAYLAKKVDENDTFVVHISDHGTRNEIPLENSNSNEIQEVTEIVLPYGNINELDLERYLSKIKPKWGLVTTDICYGGALATRVGKGKYVGIAQTTAKDLGYERMRDSFGGFFYQAFRKTGEADENGDGSVTLNEAFDYAKEKHSWSKLRIVIPQLFSDIDVKSLTIK